LTAFGVGGFTRVNANVGDGDGEGDGDGDGDGDGEGGTEANSDTDGEGVGTVESPETRSASRGTEQAASGRTADAAETTATTMRPRLPRPQLDPLTRRHRSR
jgi:hypothetical protein